MLSALALSALTALALSGAGACSARPVTPGPVLERPCPADAALPAAPATLQAARGGTSAGAGRGPVRDLLTPAPGTCFVPPDAELWRGCGVVVSRSAEPGVPQRPRPPPAPALR